MQHAGVGDVVAVHYRGFLADGTEFDASAPGRPLTFRVGEKGVVKGFSRAVEGMIPGERKRVRLKPRQAYGERLMELIFQIPRSRLGEPLWVGKTVPLPHSSGRTVPARIAGVAPTFVTVDANHELAGKTLIFDIQLEAVKASASVAA